MTGFYEKNRNKQFPLENFPDSRSHSPYYILEASTPTDEFFLRDGINKNGQYLEFLRERHGFCQRIISEEKHSFELKLWEYNKDYEIYYWGNFQVEIIFFGFSHKTFS